MQLKKDYRKDISYYKQLEEKINKQVIKEQNKLDEALYKIELVIKANSNLDIEQLVEIIIYRGLVTRDRLTKQQLYESTKSLVQDYLDDLVIEANYN